MVTLILATSLTFFSLSTTEKVECTKTGSVNVGGTEIELSVTAATCSEARKGLRAAKRELRQL